MKRILTVSNNSTVHFYVPDEFELIKAHRVHFQGEGGSFVKFTGQVSYTCSNLLEFFKLAKVGASEV